MYLNRIKQGYQPFFGLPINGMNDDTQYDYSNKYGECLDCSIGVKVNPLYNHKQENYVKNLGMSATGDYYTLDTLDFELEYMVQGPQDDKYHKRYQRYMFIRSIRIHQVDALFKIIGKHIT
jgi:hypothetical protein